MQTMFYTKIPQNTTNKINSSRKVHLHFPPFFSSRRFSEVAHNMFPFHHIHFHSLLFVSAATSTLIFMFRFVPVYRIYHSVQRVVQHIFPGLFLSPSQVGKTKIHEQINDVKLAVKYEDTYLDKYLARVEKEEEGDKDVKERKATNDTYSYSYNTKILMEMTPNGNVVMFYSTDRESFQYYSDNSIPYRYLETVARKYVLTFDCLNLYIDMKTELKKIEQEAESAALASAAIAAASKATTKSAETQIGIKKPQFAKFKTYNKATSLDSVVPQQHHHQQQQQQQQQQQHVQKKEEKTSKGDVKAQANRFSYEGKILNFMFLKKPTIPITSQQKTSYADFKASCWVRIEPSSFSE